MRHAAAVALLVATLVLGRAAQEAASPASAPSPAQIIQKYITAIGGPAAWEKLNSRVVRGSWEGLQSGQTAMGEIELFWKAPNKSGFVLEIDFVGKVRRGFNGSAGWSENPQTGLLDMSGEELENMKRDAVFHQALKLQELYPKMLVKGKENVGDRDVWWVEAHPATGTPRNWYFDTETGLLLKSASARQTPQGPVTTVAFFEDYREVDGVKLAFVIRQESPIIQTVIKLADVKHNVPVDDARFEKPAPPAPKP